MWVIVDAIIVNRPSPPPVKLSTIKYSAAHIPVYANNAAQWCLHRWQLHYPNNFSKKKLARSLRVNTSPDCFFPSLHPPFLIWCGSFLVLSGPHCRVYCGLMTIFDMCAQEPHHLPSVYFLPFDSHHYCKQHHFFSSNAFLFTHVRNPFLAKTQFFLSGKETMYLATVFSCCT